MRPSCSLQRLANPNSLFQSQHFYANKSIAQLSNKAAYPISLKQMIAFGKDIDDNKLFQSGNFVRQELPVRIAHRVRDLQNLPFVVGLNPHLERVYLGYLEVFEKIRHFPPIRTLDDNEKFCEFLRDSLRKHWGTVPRMLTGLLESAPHLPAVPRERFMTRMLRSRISRRVLAEQHLALTNQFNDLHDHGPAAKQGRHIGIIDTSLSPAESIKALEPLLPKVTGVKTEIIIEGNTDVRLAFIQEHIQYIVFELLKNSVLAALKTGRPDAAGKVYVTIADNPMSVGIRVSDEAGGIPSELRPVDLDGRTLYSASRSNLLTFANPRQMDNLPVLRQTERFGATIEEQIGLEANKRMGEPGQRQPIGISLSVCKVYAEYFGGHLQLYTMDGFGSDAYLEIPKLAVLKPDVT